MSKRFGFILLALLMCQQVDARLVESDGASTYQKIENEAKSLWQSMKTKVTGFWNQLTAPKERGQEQQAQVVNQQAPAVTEVENKARVIANEQLPSYKTQTGREQDTIAAKESLKEIKSQKALQTSEPGRQADVNLPKSKSGVVVLSLKSIKKIPAMNIGLEPKMSRYDWQVNGFQSQLGEFQSLKPLSSPQIVDEKDIKSALGQNVEKVEDAKQMNVSAFGPDEKVSFETVRKIVLQPKAEFPVTEKEISLMSGEEVKMLKAQIILEKSNKCHLATGLLSDLTNSTNVEVQNEAHYHLALCLHQMGLFTESIRRMKDVIRTAKGERLSKAINVLTQDLPKEFEEEIATELKKVSEADVPKESKDSFHYIIAKASARQEHFNTALEHSLKVSKTFAKWPQAQYIAAVAEYSLENKKASIDRQKALKQHLIQTKSDKDLFTLVSLNLARMAFQDKRFKDAIENYSEIHKGSPMWVDALIEQGWTQLMMNDPSGAIGNMYSIHSPYFKSVYQPESFVVRTIGYLNICQYGDAYRTLSQLENMHRTWLEKIKAYRKNSPAAITHYNTLVKYLKSSTTQVDMDGLPYQVIRELGRHRDYLNIQEAINARVDEVEQYGFVRSLIAKDKANVSWLIKKSKERTFAINENLKKAAKNTALAPRVNEWKREKNFEANTLANLEFELAVYEDSHKLFNSFEKVAYGRLNARKQELQVAAGEMLQRRLKRMEQKLVSILENNELLRYEVFAGSGENIRFYAAGGKSGESAKRVPASAKPESKALKWSFDGEFWEDEIGNYRSSLKNACPEGRKS